MAEYDLTTTNASFLDRHLAFPLIEFIQGSQIFNEDDILKAKLDLLEKTNMIDFAKDTYMTLYKSAEVPQEMEQRRQEIISKLNQLSVDVEPLLVLFKNPNLVAELRDAKNFTPQHLQEQYKIGPDGIETLYNYAKFHYDCGIYSTAAECLSHYRVLSNSNSERNYSALWGKLSAEILMLHWDKALEDLTHLKEIIDTKTFSSPLQQLNHRTWFIHWSLFVHFNHPNGKNNFIDLFLQTSDQQRHNSYLNVLQTSCPHVLRYLTAAIITTKRRRNTLSKELVRIIQQEQYHYKDPLTEFVECVEVNLDFEKAQQKLKECEVILSNDFFLVSCRDEFMENARFFIFENYCRIHQCIDISVMAERLEKNQESAEKWIVEDLIKNSKFDAKINSADNHLIIRNQIPSVYQQVIEMTKALTFKSHILAGQLSQKNKNVGATTETQEL